MRILFSRNFAYAKFCENKTLANISEFTPFDMGCNVIKSTLRYATSSWAQKNLPISVQSLHLKVQSICSMNGDQLRLRSVQVAQKCMLIYAFNGHICLK